MMHVSESGNRVAARLVPICRTGDSLVVRERMRRLLAEWSEADRAHLAQLIVRLSDEMDSLGQVVSSSADTRAPVTSGSGR